MCFIDIWEIPIQKIDICQYLIHVYCIFPHAV